MKELLWRTNDPQLAGVPFLLMFNKNDREDKVAPEIIIETLMLEHLEKVRPVRTQVCSALDGSGIWEGLNQLVEMIETPPSSSGGDKASTSETTEQQPPTDRKPDL